MSRRGDGRARYAVASTAGTLGGLLLLVESWPERYVVAGDCVEPGPCPPRVVESGSVVLTVLGLTAVLLGLLAGLVAARRWTARTGRRRADDTSDPRTGRPSG